MFEACIAQAEGIDTSRTVAAVLSRLERQLDGARPAALICHAGVHLDHELLLREIARAWPQAPLAGCTTSGELSSDLGFSEDSLALLAFVSDSMTFATALAQDLASSPERAVRQALDACDRALQAPVALSLCYADSRDGAADAMVTQLRQRLGAQTPLFGGVAGRLLEQPGPARVFCGRLACEDAMVLLCMSGPAVLDMAISHSWRPLGEPLPVNRSQGSRLVRVGGQSARDYYRSYLGSQASPASQFPLAVYPESPPDDADDTAGAPGRDYYIRSPYDSGEDGDSILFAGEIPEGAYVGITEATPAGILEDTRSVAENLSRSLYGAPALALVFSCAARKDILGTRTRRELEILQGALPSGLPLFGFYSFGEIGPVAKGRNSHLHNCTMLLLLLGEQGYTPDYRFAQAPHVEDPCDCCLSPCQENMETLRQEIRFTRARLQRSEAARARLEEARDMDTALLRNMNEELKGLAEELAASEEKYRRIVETAGEGFLLMDQDLEIQYANDACCRLLGREREQIVGRQPFQLMTAKHSRMLQQNRSEMLAQDYRRFEVELQHADGGTVPVLVNANTLRNEKGEVLGHVAFVTDMSDQKKALALAGELQQSLMPGAAPNVPGLELAGRSVPCQEVGGDFYDYLMCPETPEAVTLAVADISGHGVDAALLMSAARAFLRMRAAQPGGLDRVVTEMNSHLSRDLGNSGRFLTLLALCLDPCRCSLDYVRAGHDPLLLYDPAAGSFREPSLGMHPLGVLDDTVYSAERIEDIAAGSVLVLGTDGIWEARNREGEMFGKERFRQVIRANGRASASAILEAVFAALEDFGEGITPEDDRTLVVARLQG